MVALGKEYAGLFSNDEKLAADLIEASSATGEKVWRMPLDKAFDKLIDSKNADVKNIGGRWGARARRRSSCNVHQGYAVGPHRRCGHRHGRARNDINQAGARAGASGCSTSSLPRATSDKRGRVS